MVLADEWELPVVSAVVEPPEFFCPRIRMRGISTADPIRERTALNVNPPT